MARIDLSSLNQEYYDILREIGNIGAGNATTALSQILNCKVDMSVPEVSVLDFNQMGEVMGGDDKIMTSVYLMVEGDISGSIMFLLEKESARSLVARLMGVKEETEELTEMEQSAIKEIGNIITASYLNSLATLTGLKIYPSVPALCVDMAGAIMSVPAIEFGTMGDKILLIQNKFGQGLDGFFVLVPDLESYDVILDSLGV